MGSFNLVSGQITSDALWEWGEKFDFWLVFPSALIKLNHGTKTSIVANTKECASLYVRKLGAAGYTQILLVVVKISVVHKSVASEARLNISHQRRDLLSTCFLVFFIPFYLSSLLLFQIQPFHKVCKMRLNRISYCFQC